MKNRQDSLDVKATMVGKGGILISFSGRCSAQRYVNSYFKIIGNLEDKGYRFEQFVFNSESLEVY